MLPEPAPDDLAWVETAKMRDRLNRSSIASLALVSPPNRPSIRNVPEVRSEPAYLSCVIANKTTKDPSIREGGRRYNQSLDSSRGSRNAVSERERSRAKPVYSEEQKFFIMYARIVLDLSWGDIGDRFSDIFGHRSKDGITSMYYRIRKSWGLKDILKAGPDSYSEDKHTVLHRASYLSEAFLSSISYYP